MGLLWLLKLCSRSTHGRGPKTAPQMLVQRVLTEKRGCSTAKKGHNPRQVEMFEHLLCVLVSFFPPLPTPPPKMISFPQNPSSALRIALISTLFLHYEQGKNLDAGAFPYDFDVKIPLSLGSCRAGMAWNTAKSRKSKKWKSKWKTAPKKGQKMDF